MKTCKAVFFVSESDKHITFINFIKNSGLPVQIKVFSSFSPADAASACLVFVDEKTARMQGSKLAEIKEKSFRFSPLLLLADHKESDKKLFADFFDDVVPVPFSENEWQRRLKTYLSWSKKGLTDTGVKKEYDALFANNHSIMLLIDPDTGHIAEANGAACKFYGYSYSELTSMKIQDINQLDNERVFIEMENARSNKKNFFIFKHRLADGSIKTVEVHSGNITRNNKPYLFSIIYDITDRINAEKQLNETLENYRQVIENAPDIVILIDKKGIIRFVNQRIREFSNYTEKDIVGKPITSFIPPEDHQKAFAAIKQVFENKQKATHFLSSFILKDGKKIPVTTKGTSVKFGSDILNMTIIRDISFIKEAEAKLQQSKKTFEDIFNNRSVAIYIQDTSGKFIDINRAALKQYGFNDKKELIGKTPEFVSAEGKNNLNQIKEYLAKALKGEPQQFEFWAKRKDGSVFPKLVVVENGTYYGKPVVYNFSFDITERKKMEKAYQESEEMLNSIFNSAPSPANLINKKFEVVLSNRSLLNLRKVSLDDVIGKKCYKVFHDRSQICAHCAVKQVFQTHKPVGSENELTLPNGETRYYNTLAYPIFDSRKKIKYVVESTVDITEKKRIQLQLEQSEAKYHHLFQYMENCVAVYAVNTENEIVIKEFNRAAEKLEKVNRDEVVGKKLKDIYPGAEDFGICSAIRKVYKTGRPNNIPAKWYEDNRVKGWREHYLYKLPSGEVVAIYNDVTKEKIAEEQLNESMENYRLLFEKAPFGILIFTPEGNIVDANPSLLNILGSPSLEATKKINVLHFAPLNKTNYVHHFKECLRTGSVVRFKTSYTSKWGKSFVSENTFVPLKDENGKVLKIYVILRDITGQFRAEQLLEDSEEKYRSFFETSSEAIAMNEFSTGKYLEINNRFLSILGYSKNEEILGKSDLELNLWVNLDDRKKLTESLKKNGFIKEIEVRFRGKNNQIIIGLLSAQLITLRGKKYIVNETRDITHIKMAEEALRESQQLFKTLANNSPTGIFRTDKKGNTTYVNPKWSEITSCSFDEAIGNGWQKYLHPEDRKRLIKHWQKRIEEQESSNERYRIVRSDGTIRWVLGYAVPEMVDGELKGYVGTITDITNLVLTEKALRESELKYREQFKLFRLMSDDIPILVWAKDLEGRFMFVNKATCNKLLMATDIEEPIGKKDLFFADRQRQQHPDRKNWFTFGETCINSDAVVLKNKKPQRFDEYGYVQGKFLFLDVYKAPIFDENGKIIGTVGYGMDVTKEKEAERELLLRDKALNAAANAIIITDANGIFKWVNEAFTKLSGYTKEEALGKATTDLIGSGKQDKAFYDNLNNTLKSGNVWVGEFIDKRKDGTLYEVEEIITPVTNEAGEVEHLIGIMNDITERKANERELKAAKQAAEESSRLKSAFLANMNHEIRTPMNAIMGFSELMLGATSEEKENYAKIVNNSSVQLLKLIDDIIFLSRLQSEKLPVKNTPFNPKKIIEQIFNMFNIPEMKKNLNLEMEFDDKVSDLTIEADVDKAKQVLTNLVSNAIKYTKSGFVKIGALKKNDTIIFFVEDSGMGISEEEQKRVFDSFFRGRMAVKNAIRGTGLGLNIAKELVELMNGTIGVSSKLGAGSRFFFTIPFKEAASNKVKKSSPLFESKKWSELNILVAEDDDTNYLYLEVLLQNKVKRLDRAVDGLKALELAKKIKYDLILMDIKMPVMSGEAATREIKKLFPKIPVIATTANVSPEEKESALKAGCDDYLSKPIKKEDLMAVINKFVSGK